jgi:hypothetical protein
MNVDLRVPSTSTKPTAWSMQNLQDNFHDQHGSTQFFSVTLSSVWKPPKISKTRQFAVIKLFTGIESHTSESYYRSYKVATFRVNRSDS